MKIGKKILLIGGSGKLGSSILKSKLFKNITAPSKKKLNILKKKSIRKILKQNFDLIINCAAIARMKECEVNPNLAINVNIYGVLNLVEEIVYYNDQNSKKIKLIHISTDGVYSPFKGNHSEKDIPKPYNIYGWTKLCSESLVKFLDNYIIVRTRFFDKKNILYETAATDIYTSMIEVRKLVKEIKNIFSTNFNGIINIGDKKKSDFFNYKKFKKNIKPCCRVDIMKNLNFKIAKDASLNLNLYKKIKKKYA